MRGERKLPLFHPLRSGMIFVQPDQHWFCSEGLWDAAEKQDSKCIGIFKHNDANLSGNWKLTSALLASLSGCSFKI